MLLVLAFAAFFMLESIAVHHFYSARFPGVGDFYVSWAGARALLLEGRDPYSQEVTTEIQEAKGIDPSLPGKGGFAYPLHVLFVFWPLVFLPYVWVQAIWMVTLQWVAVAALVVLLRLEDWTPGPLAFLGLSLGVLFLYPVGRSIMLGQVTLHVTLLLAIVILALRHRRDAWAGAALALTSIKPQMVIFIIPWVVSWAVSRRRWRVLGGLFASGTLLLLGSLALFPRWPISFLESVTRHRVVVEGRNPIVVLLSLLWSDRSAVLRYSISAGLIVAMLSAWKRGLRGTDGGFARATHWTIVVSLLVPFQTGTTNQAMLLIPFVAWLRMALKNWESWIVLGGAGGLELGMWMLFLATISGNWENPAMFLPLPLLGLTVLMGIELNDWWRNRSPSIVVRSDDVP